jgi:hypothetical protein
LPYKVALLVEEYPYRLKLLVVNAEFATEAMRHNPFDTCTSVPPPLTTAILIVA